MSSGKKRTIASKFLAPMVLVIILTILVIVIYSFSVIKKIQTSVYQKETLAMTSRMDETITSALDICLTNSITLSANTALVDALVLRDDVAALEILSKVSDNLSDMFGHDFKIHMHTEDVKSFLRAWNPEKNGDDLSGFRSTILKVKETKNVVSAFEIGRAGLTLRGLSPMMQMEDYYVGSLEVMLSSDVVVENSDINSGYYVLVGIKQDMIKKDAPVVNGYKIMSNDLTNKAFYDEFLVAPEEVFSTGNKFFETPSYFGSRYPILDLGGNEIGMFYIAKDIGLVHAEIAAAERLAITQIVMTLIGFGLIVVLMIVLLKLVITKKLKSLIDTTFDLAEGDGDLTKRIDMITNDEFETASENMNRFIEKVQGTVQTSIDGMHDTVSASEQLSSTSSTLSGNIATQTERVEQSSALVTEVADSLDKTEELAVTTTEVLERGRDSLQELVSSMDDVVERIVADSESQLKMADDMQNLNDQAKQIQDVLSIISDIADQTNLLALNASIEAARAGEHGRGFAVVADEVRKLAERTQTSLADISKSTNQIVSSIGDASTSITDVSESMRDASEKSKELVTLADDTSVKLDETVSVSSEMVKMTTFIATKTKDMISAMDEVMNLSLENSQAGQSVEEVAGSLAEKSSVVSEQLKRFKV